MASTTGKRARKQMYEDMGETKYQKVHVQKFPVLTAQSYKQEDYIEAIKNKDVVFALGSAGSGKSYVATHYAAEQLYYKKIDKIILTRPVVEACGEELGFLPGDLIEGKMMPYLAPYMETLNELLGKTFVEYCLKVGTIEPVPLAFMRGRSFKNCLILAVVIIQGSLDNTNWIDLGTLNISNTVLTGGLTLINTVWPLYRCIATLTPGVGSITSVTVNMGIES